MQACDRLVTVMVQLTAKQWEDDHVLQWLYDNLQELKQRDDENNLPVDDPPSVALMKYCDMNPSDYENKIQLLPEEANIIDPGMLAHAMAIVPNRGRLLRHQRGGGGGGGGGMPDMMMMGQPGMVGQQQHLLGPPTQIVDPDWPMLEVFWRSFMPWNHVEGVPPPRR
jgi:hypothetical protein